MKKRLLILPILSLVLSGFVQDNPISEEQGMTVVNTTTICPKVRGYADAVPVKIYIKDGKISKIKSLPNAETPKFWALIKKELMPKWIGMDVKTASKAKVDAITGATLSSKALQKNIQAGCGFYIKKVKSEE